MRPPTSRPLQPGLYRYPRKLVVWAICFAPANWLRVTLYRAICGYVIAPRARIGFGTVIAVDGAEIGDATVGRFNRFQGPFLLRIGDGSSIGDRNAFDCGEWIVSAPGVVRPRVCAIGADTLITGHHYIDASQGFTLGERSWIAGRDTQIWTHGAGVPDGGVRIGADCYVGSAARFAPGSGVGDGCAVGMGAVVTKYIGGSCLLVAGVPARIVRENVRWRDRPIETSPDTGDAESASMSRAATGTSH